MKTIQTIFKKTVLLLLLALPSAVQAATTIDIIATPVGERLDIVVTVTSQYALKSVTAEVSGRTLQLTYSTGDKKYRGSIDMAGLPEGKLPLRITVEDALGNIQTATKDFIHNSFPEIVVEAPSDYSAHHSRIRIKARVMDPGSASCKGAIRSWWGSAEFINSIDTVLMAPSEVNAYDTYVTVSATDSAGQRSEKRVYVYLDNSPYLKEQYTAAGVIADFRDSRLLTMNTLSSKEKKTFDIVNMLDSSVTHIPIDSMRQTRESYIQGVLCPGGAVFNVYYIATQRGNQLLLWRNDSLINVTAQLGVFAANDPVGGEGNYAIWRTTGNRIAVTDVTTLVTTFIGTSPGSYSLSRQGEVAYGEYKTGLNIFRYSIASQTTVQITYDGNKNSPLIDSNDIVYHRPSLNSDTLFLYNGQRQRLVSPATLYSKVMLRDGYILFNKNDDVTNIRQVWLSTPADTLRQLSFFSKESMPDLLGDHGTAFFVNNNNKDRYYTDNNTSFKRVSGGYGKAYNHEGKLYLALGGTLFRYAIGEDTVPPLPANSFTITNTGASCRGSANGAINVSAKQAGDYMATLTGNGKDSTYAFTRSLTVDGLAAGTYNICLAPREPQRPPQCFTSVIKEPADLSAAMVTSEEDGKTRLVLSGGDRYHVEVNGRLQTTQAGEIEPELRNGLNTIVISTDKPCQGHIVKHITREGDATVYPNPFSQSFMIGLGSKPVSRTVVTLYDAGGKIVYSRVYTQQSGVITIEPGDIGTGMYMLKLNADQREQTFKLLKK